MNKLIRFSFSLAPAFLSLLPSWPHCQASTVSQVLWLCARDLYRE